MEKKKRLPIILTVIGVVVLLVLVLLFRSCGANQTDNSAETEPTIQTELSTSQSNPAETTLPITTEPSNPAEPEPEPNPNPEPESNPESDEAKLEHIEISSGLNKTEYFVGDMLDTTGLILLGYYSDGSTTEIKSGFTCSPSALGTAGDQKINVQYQNKSVSLTVHVSAVELESISVRTKPNKSVYIQGNTLDVTGLSLTAKYNNGSEKIITSGFTCTPMELTSYGNMYVTVQYGGMETKFDIYVSKPSITSIAVDTMPNKTVYGEEEIFDSTGLTLTVYYNNGTEKTLTSGYDTSPRTLYYRGGSNEITVYYEGYTTTFSVQVHPVIVGSGQCGDNVTWEQTKGGTLIISGTGRLYDYKFDNSTGCTTPWGKVENVVISEGVTYIGKYAFYMQSGLSSVKIANSVQEIGEFAFAQCPNLSSITIPDGMTTIRRDVFRGSGLSSVTIGKGLSSIGNEAFALCRYLSEISVDKANPNFMNDDYGALYTKDQSELVVFPTDVTGKLVLPNGLKIIRASAVRNSKLSEVVIPDSVTEIGFYAFYDSKSLTRVTIGSGVKKILTGVFQNCSSLEEITLYSKDCTIYDMDNVLGKSGVTTVYAYTGSTAEAYAKKYGYTFVAI